MATLNENTVYDLLRSAGKFCDYERLAINHHIRVPDGS